MAPSWLRAAPGGVVIRVWAQPGARRGGVAGVQGDRLKIKVAAPPVEGKANAELIRMLSTLLGVRKTRLRLIAGDSGRQKDVLVEGTSVADVAAMLAHPT